MSRFEDPQWIEKVKERRGQGSNLVKDVKTGFMEDKQGKGFNAKKKVRFLEVYKEDKPLYEALNLVGVNRNTFYAALATDPEFRRQYVDIDEAFTDQVEQTLKQNAKTNKMASAERIFYLKKKRPEIYADKIEVKHSGSSDDTVKQLMAKMASYHMIPKDSIVDVKGEESNEGIKGAETEENG